MTKCGAKHPLCDAICSKDAGHAQPGSSTEEATHQGWTNHFGGSTCYWERLTATEADEGGPCPRPDRHPGVFCVSANKGNCQTCELESGAFVQPSEETIAKVREEFRKVVNDPNSEWRQPIYLDKAEIPVYDLNTNEKIGDVKVTMPEPGKFDAEFPEGVEPTPEMTEAFRRAAEEVRKNHLLALEDPRSVTMAALDKGELTDAEGEKLFEAIDSISAQDGEGSSLLDAVDPEVAAAEAEIEAAGPVKVAVATEE